MGQEATLAKELMSYFVPGAGIGGIVFIVLIIWYHYRLKEVKIKACAALEKAKKSADALTALQSDVRVILVEIKNMKKESRLEDKLDKVLSTMGKVNK